MDELYDVTWKDKAGWMRVHFAARYGKTHYLKELIERGANINVKTTDYKETPLHFAILEGYEEIVELLIEHKADINCQDEYNNTPLHKAAIEN